MTRDEFNAALREIGTCEDETQRRELLAQLEENAGADYENHAAVTAERDQLRTDNEELRSANMKLFLRIGDHKEPPKDTPKDTPKYADLFNEKGELK